MGRSDYFSWAIFFFLFALGASYAWWLETNLLLDEEVSPANWNGLFSAMLALALAIVLARGFFAKKNLGWKFVDDAARRIMPYLLTMWLASACVSLADPYGFLKYSRYLPLIWVGCYGMALAHIGDLHRNHLRWVGEVFFFMAALYVLAGSYYDRTVFEWAPEFLWFSLGFLNLLSAAFFATMALLYKENHP